MVPIRFLNRSHLFLIVYLTLFVFYFKTNANDFSSKIILEGLRNAHIGGELSYRKINFRLTGALNSFDNSFWSIDGNIHLGVIVKKTSDYDWIVSMGAYLQYTRAKYLYTVSNVALRIKPSIDLSMYRYFNKFLIGGCVDLELWEGNKSFFNETNTGWQANRLFNIVPEFIIGYRF